MRARRTACHNPGVVGKQGYVLTYTSYRALEADHAAYMTHGAMVIPVEETAAPDHDTEAVIKIVAPDETAFEIPIRTGHFLKGRGIMVSFDSEGVAAQTALDSYVKSADFTKMAKAEPESKKEKPKLDRYQAADAPAAPPAPASQQAAGVAAATETRQPARRSRSLQPRGKGAAKTGTELRRPGPGEKYIVYAVKFFTVTDYLDVLPRFEAEQLFEVLTEETDAKVNTPCMLRLQLPGHNIYEVWGVIEDLEPARVLVRVDANDDAYRRAVIHPTTVSSKARLARETESQRQEPRVIRIEEEVPEEDASKMPIRRRLARMGMDDKINMALSGDREERMALAMDSNKAVHHYLLKNAKITLDEVAFMARLPSLNPDVLDRIAENPAYTQNPTIAKALVYNPRTPVKTAIRLLDRLPRSEVMNLSKRTNMNMRLVMAAKKKMERRSI